jgi:predicted Holliday junction resolvase-like endonuclease
VTTEQIIWTVVIIVAVLALIAFIVSAMRKKSQHTKETRAAELRQEAQQRAAVIPDAQVRAKESEAEAERKRLEAEQAAERAQAARTEVVQHEATVEEQVREADRLDPRVDHKSSDYTPDTSSVIGTHAAERTTAESPDPHPSGASTGMHASDTTTTRTTNVTEGYDERSDSRDPDTIFDSRDETTSTDTHTTTDTDGTTGETGGSHRA